MRNIEDIRIYALAERHGICPIEVIWHDPEAQTYWSKTFEVRGFMGNPTELGRKMGIRCRDKKILNTSPKGESIQHYLYGLAKRFAGKLSYESDQPIKDNSPFNKNRYRNVPARFSLKH